MKIEILVVINLLIDHQQRFRVKFNKDILVMSNSEEKKEVIVILILIFAKNEIKVYY